MGGGGGGLICGHFRTRPVSFVDTNRRSLRLSRIIDTRRCSCGAGRLFQGGPVPRKTLRSARTRAAPSARIPVSTERSERSPVADGAGTGVPAGYRRLLMHTSARRRSLLRIPFAHSLTGDAHSDTPRSVDADVNADVDISAVCVDYETIRSDDGLNPTGG